MSDANELSSIECISNFRTNHLYTAMKLRSKNNWIAQWVIVLCLIVTSYCLLSDRIVLLLALFNADDFQTFNNNTIQNNNPQLFLYTNIGVICGYHKTCRFDGRLWPFFTKIELSFLAWTNNRASMTVLAIILNKVVPKRKIWHLL